MRIWRTLIRLLVLVSIMAGVYQIVNVMLPEVRHQRQLFAACAKDDLPEVERLLRVGVRLEPKNRFGETPLIVAASGRYHSVASRLVDAGADPTATNRWGETALILALRAGEPQLAGKLIEKGASVNARDRQGTPALILAFDQRCASLVEPMLDLGADPRAVGPDGQTALMLALAHGDTMGSTRWEVVMEGKPRWISMKELRTLAKSGAVRRVGRHIEQSILPRLVQTGIDVNARDRGGHTALMWAVASGELHLVRKCLRWGADPTAVDADGDSALDRAEGAGFEEIAAELRSAQRRLRTATQSHPAVRKGQTEPGSQIRRHEAEAQKEPQSRG